MENVIHPVENIANLPQSNENTVTVDQILARMDRIIAQGEQLTQVLEQIQALPKTIDSAARAEAIGNIYTSHERTNQALLDLLRRMYIEMTRP